MSTTSISCQGQVTIPADVRERLRLSPGDRVEFVYNDSTGHYEVIPAIRSIRELKGIVPKPPEPLSIEDMNEIIARGAAGDRH